jgi:hypothetical protein
VIVLNLYILAVVILMITVRTPASVASLLVYFLFRIRFQNTGLCIRRASCCSFGLRIPTLFRVGSMMSILSTGSFRIGLKIYSYL